MLISVFINLNRFWVSISGKIIILVPVFFCSAPGLFCQEITPSGKSNTICFSIGSNQIKETILNPKVHKGSTISVSYMFEKEISDYHEFIFKIGYSGLKTKIETEKVTMNEQISASYSWGKRLLSREKIKYYLGADLNYSWELMEYPVWDESRAYWGTAISAGPFTRVNILFDNKRSMISSLHLDLIGFCSRPDEIRLYAQEEWTLSNILKITNSGFSFGTPDSFILCSLRNEYRIAIKKDDFISFCNSVTYVRISANNEQHMQNIRINFGIGLGF